MLDYTDDLFQGYLVNLNQPVKAVPRIKTAD